jgi:hypothetical protein
MIYAILWSRRRPAFFIFLAGFLVAFQIAAAGVAAAAGHAFGLASRCRHFAFVAGAGQAATAFFVGITMAIFWYTAGSGSIAMMRSAAAIR